MSQPLPTIPAASTLARIFLGAAWLALTVAAGARPGGKRVEMTEEQREKVAAALPTRAEAAPPAKERRMLVFHRTEDWVHGCLPIANHTFVELGRATGAYVAELSEDMAVFTPANLRRFDAVMLNNTTRLAFADATQRAALLEFVKRGGGLVGVHAAADNFLTWPEGSALIGAQFTAHPWSSRGTWAVKLDEPGHPLAAAFGGRGFWVQDEIYELSGTYSRATHRVLLSVDMSKANSAVKGRTRFDGDYPLAWVKRAGDGRVFYCSLGHNFHMYWNPAVLRFYLAGIQYAMGDRVAPDAPSATLRPAPDAALAPESAPAMEALSK